ncbi:MAG: hypothetical protein NC918_07775 [Candidatus Omnitrophica bacterium]|nr:hypothetical protein [Candidatus Omnitrophota bacterium]
MIVKKEDLKNKLENYIFMKLNQEEYEIIECDPRNLLTWNRLITAFDLFYLDMKDKNDKLARYVYTERVRAATLGTFIESDGQKAGIEMYIREFEKTYDSLRKNGFDPAISVIPLAKDLSILNASHRVASAIHLGKSVYCVRTELDPICDDFKELYRRRVDYNILDIVVQKFIEYSNNTFIAFLWESSRKYHKKIETLFKNIVYIKNIKLNMNGAYNLLMELYKHMDWIGTAKDNYAGIRQKLIECFTDFKGFKIIIFQSNSLNEVRELKDKIRQICKMGYSSIHITDTKEEALRIAKLLLNENAIHFLNHANLNKYPNISKEIANFKNFLSENGADPVDVLIDGSFVLALYGLRQSEDIDYLINDKYKKFESDKYNEHSAELIFHRKSKEDLIYDPRYHFEYQGIKFISFASLYEMKKNRSELKDKIDCKIMEAYLRGNKISLYLRNIEQNLLYLIIKTKHRTYKKIITVLKIFNLYEPVRKIYKRLIRIRR